jgi:hypothetical protein
MANGLAAGRVSCAALHCSRITFELLRILTATPFKATQTKRMA